MFTLGIDGARVSLYSRSSETTNCDLLPSLFPELSKEQVTNQRTPPRYPAAAAHEHLCHYTYLLLLLKRAVYFVIIAFCIYKRTGVSNNGKSS